MELESEQEKEPLCFQAFAVMKSRHSITSFPGGASGKESPCQYRGPSSIPGLGRSPGGGHGNPLEYSRLKNAMDKEFWQARVHKFPKIWTGLKRLNTPLQYFCLENHMDGGAL